MTGIEPWYNEAEAIRRPCPGDCKPCARCSRRDEGTAKRLTRPKGCTCEGLDLGIDPCFSPGSCECFCQNYLSLVERCPDLAGTF